MSMGTVAILLVGAAFVVGVMVLSLRNARLLAAVCGVLIVVSSIGVHVTWSGSIYRTWLLPLQSRRTEVFLAVSSVMFALAMINISRVPRKVLPVQAVILLLIGVYAGFLRFIHSDPLDAAISVASALWVVPAVVYGYRTTITDHRTCMKAVRVIAYAGLAWMFLSLVQFVINPSLVTTRFPVRFIGVTSNPQSAAVFLAPVTVTALWLGLNDTSRAMRPLWYVCTSLAIIMLIWTGSRTGLLMFFAGAAFVTYPRFGRAVFALPVLAVAVFGLVSAAATMGVELPFERLLAGGNTRSDAWQALWSIATSHPLLGAGQGEDMSTENSILLGFAAYGIVMLGLVVLMLASCFWICYKLFFGRGRLLKEYRPFVDIVVGYNAAYVVGSMFEGYIISRVSTNFVLMLMFAAIGSSLLHWKTSGAILESTHGYDDGEDDGSQYEIETHADEFATGEHSVVSAPGEGR